MMEQGEDEVRLRTFCDQRNRAWEVRAIRPDRTDRRRARLVADELANGWLLFTMGLERRRLAPLPPEWHQASDSQLVRWLTDAEQVETPSHHHPAGEPQREG